jgi:carboxyl-terminal processing protease
VAYLNVPWFVPNDEMSSTAYVDDLHKLIASLDTGNVTGWVLDLRENTGGNSWPMLAGLGPLLDEGLLGFYRSLDEPEIPWGYKDGAAWGYNMTQASGSGAPYRLKDTSKPRLAVLTGKNTASAGELLSVVLKGLPHARSFGAETSGQATVNERFELPDGSIMFLATGCFADRTGKNYPSKIAPDEKIENSGTSEDLVLNRALSWIKKPGPVSAAKPRVLKPL